MENSPRLNSSSAPAMWPGGTLHRIVIVESCGGDIVTVRNGNRLRLRRTAKRLQGVGRCVALVLCYPQSYDANEVIPVKVFNGLPSCRFSQHGEGQVECKAKWSKEAS